jgi:hypothetical protein
MSIRRVGGWLEIIEDPNENGYAYQSIVNINKIEKAESTEEGFDITLSSCEYSFRAKGGYKALTTAILKTSPSFSPDTFGRVPL